MKDKLGRLFGGLLGALVAMIGPTITKDMDWSGFITLFTGAGAPIVVLGLTMVAWTAWRDGSPIKRPKMLAKVMGGKE